MFILFILFYGWIGSKYIYIYIYIIHNTLEIQGIVSTSMVLRNDLNRGPSRDLVKMLAFWLSVWMNSRHNFIFHQIMNEVIVNLYVLRL